MTRAFSPKYLGLQARGADGVLVVFVDGEADVDEAQAEALRALPAEFEVTVTEDSGGGEAGGEPAGVAGGEVDSDELFDPSKHNADVVNAHLEGADDAERERVLAAEREGKNRKGITGDE